MKDKVWSLLTVALGVAVALLAVVAYGLLMSSVRIGGHGTIKAVGVGVFWDVNCSVPVVTIDWGLVEPGSGNNVTIYVRNEGNAAGMLSLLTENWNPPEASGYLVLTWDYDGSEISPGEVLPIVLTLTVSENVQGITGFSYDMVICLVG